MKPFKITYQYDQMDCGPACVSMILNHYGKELSLSSIRNKAFLSKEGVSLSGISSAAQNFGFTTYPIKTQLDKLIDLKDALPAILHWNKNHFVVLHKISKGKLKNKYLFHIADPGHGKITLDEKKFKESWLSDDNCGIALLLEPTENLQNNREDHDTKPLRLKYFLQFVQPYKTHFIYLFLLLLVGSATSLAFPFLTQKLIDVGIRRKNFNYITLILLGQLFLNLGSITFEVIRNWITLHIGANIGINIIAVFFKRLMKLPISFFDTKMIGDFNQRIQDNERIETFLTSESLLTCFSMLTFAAFFWILIYYDFKIMLVFSALTVMSIFWTLMWNHRRKILDYHRFRQRSEGQEFTLEMLYGIAELKLNSFENHKLSEWRKLQQNLYKVGIKVLKINQLQLSGFEFLNQIKNTIVTFLAATFVIKGSMSLGQLLSISYIIGQLNSPVSQLINFFRGYQDAKLSLDRLREIEEHPVEEDLDDELIRPNDEDVCSKGIKFDHVSFQYQGPKSPMVLNDISLHIPYGKITAVVGASGSGKTTLMKLILKFYQSSKGEIFVGGHDLQDVSHSWLRQSSGVVMQDGFIFGDTIERNIICGDETANIEQLRNALWIANLQEFLESLPLGINTKIGASGNGLSGGQKQRILIARAIYKNPNFIFLDEATSALDAENEKIIHSRLMQFFEGRTVVIVAHRLSTVKKADQIIVLKSGVIVESGLHKDLVANQGDYFNLVSNQLELGA